MFHAGNSIGLYDWNCNTLGPYDPKQLRFPHSKSFILSCTASFAAQNKFIGFLMHL